MGEGIPPRNFGFRNSEFGVPPGVGCHPEGGSQTLSSRPNGGPQDRSEWRDPLKPESDPSSTFSGFGGSLDSLPASPYGLRRDKSLTRDDNETGHLASE